MGCPNEVCNFINICQMTYLVKPIVMGTKRTKKQDSKPHEQKAGLILNRGHEIRKSKAKHNVSTMLMQKYFITKT